MTLRVDKGTPSDVQVSESKDGEKREGIRVDRIDAIESDSLEVWERREEFSSSFESSIGVDVDTEVDMSQAEGLERRNTSEPFLDVDGVEVETRKSRSERL